MEKVDSSGLARRSATHTSRPHHQRATPYLRSFILFSLSLLLRPSNSCAAQLSPFISFQHHSPPPQPTQNHPFSNSNLQLFISSLPLLRVRRTTYLLDFYCFAPGCAADTVRINIHAYIYVSILELLLFAMYVRSIPAN